MDNHEYELVHHGIPGMKWGIRRYQNRDGSLTNAGKKRYEKELAKVRTAEKTVKNKEQVKAKFDRLNARKQKVADREKALEDPKKDGKKEAKKSKSTEEVQKEQPAKKQPTSVRDLSNEELQAVVNRLNLEKRYNDLQPQTPKKESFGKKFLNKMVNDAILPAAANVGKSALEGWLGGKVNELMGKTDKPKKKSDAKPDEPKPKKEKKEKADTKPETPKKKAYQKPDIQSKDTWVWDDDWWNTPAPTTRSSNDDFADLFGLPEYTEKRKKK